ncbi:MAG: tol-pal system YbgF family protein [Crocosphaera sp.]
MSEITETNFSQLWVTNFPENSLMANAGISWINLAREQANRGQWQQVIKTWQKAADSFESEGDKLNQSMALTNLSLSHQKLGQWNLAQEIDRLVDEYPESIAVIHAIILDQSLEIILKIPQQEELKYYRTKVPHKGEHPIFVSKSLKATLYKGFSHPKSANLQNWDAPTQRS